MESGSDGIHVIRHGSEALALREAKEIRDVSSPLSERKEKLELEAFDAPA